VARKPPAPRPEPTDRGSLADAARPPDVPSFYEQVYAATCEVPAGRVTTYGAVARRVSGRTSAARGVGWALHALRGAAAEDVPWWRVINSQGRVSTRCEAHPALVQRARLEDEGIPFGPDDRVDLARFGWEESS
jgi:methylated-DNA-protein-cysteine methyltransferase-like protein